MLKRKKKISYHDPENPHRSRVTPEISKEGLKIGDIIFFGYKPGDGQATHRAIRAGNRFFGLCEEQDIPFIHCEIITDIDINGHAVLGGASGGDQKLVRTIKFETKVTESTPDSVRVHRFQDKTFAKEVADQAAKLLETGLTYSTSACGWTAVPSGFKQ
jgi:hypothetical protein